MVILATALYPEALPFIEYYQLKKDSSFTKFQVFRKEDIVLILTKTGAVNAAIAVTSLCTVLNPAPNAIFLNIGVCGSSDDTIPAGALFICNKITQLETNRSFYPDMLYKHPFLEGSLLTSPLPIFQSNMSNQDFFHPILKEFALNNSRFLIDMEAAGCFQAGAYFFNTHQMHFLKTVSDHLSDMSLSPDILTDLIQQNMSSITEWIQNLKTALVNMKPFFSEEEEKRIGQIADKLKLTETMKHQLWQICRYYKLRAEKNEATYNLTLLIENYLKEIPKPIKTKTEGKMYFEEFKQRII